MSRAVVDAIFIGAKIKPAEDGGLYLKDPAEADPTPAKMKKIAEARYEGQNAGPRRFVDNPYHRPTTGVLHSIAVHDRYNNELFTATTRTGLRGEVATPFVQYMLAAFKGQFADSLAYGDVNVQTVIFGFDVKEILRIAAVEVLQKRVTTIPVRFWYNPVGVYDPLDVLFTATHQKDLDIGSAMRYFGLVGPEGWETASDIACGSRALVEAAQLMPAAPTQM
jgi:hypothetical protein